MATVTQARLVIGLEKSEGDDSGKGSSVGGKEANDNGTRKMDESKRVSRAVHVKRGYFDH